MIHSLELPQPPAPIGAYEAGIVRNGIGFVSGQFPIVNGELAFAGKIGAELTLNEGYAATETAARNVLSQLYKLTNRFDDLAGLMQLNGYVASAPGFLDQPKVLDVASGLFNEYLGEKGRHTRAAFSVSQLPHNSPVELCVSFAVL